MKQPINNPDSPLMRAHAVRVEFQPMPSCGMESPLSQANSGRTLAAMAAALPVPDPSDLGGTARVGAVESPLTAANLTRARQLSAGSPPKKTRRAPTERPHGNPHRPLLLSLDP
jgi:hypothetical protein